VWLIKLYVLYTQV